MDETETDPAPAELPAFIDAAWVGTMMMLAPPPPHLDRAKVLHLRSLATECSVAISSGFKSSALGSEHTYPSGQTDQLNLTASVSNSLFPSLPSDWTTPFTCAADPNDPASWARVPHTASQIQQVGLDGKQAVLACLEKLDGYRAQVAMAASIDDLANIVWR